MSKKDKAYRAAAEHMAAGQHTLTPEDLEAYHHGTWDVIWKAARRAEWEKCQDDLEVLQAQLEACRFNLDGVVDTAKKRLEEIRRLENAVTTAKSFTSSAQQRSIELLRSNQTLRQENDRLKAQLVQATALTTEGTKGLQGRYDKLLEGHRLVERLYENVEKENRYNQNALDLAEQELSDTREKLLQERTAHTAERDALSVDVEFWRKKYMAIPPIASRKPEGDGWMLTWTKFTGLNITGTVTPEPKPKRCEATDSSRTHVCTRTSGAHRQHVCHCNHLWTNTTS